MALKKKEISLTAEVRLKAALVPKGERPHSIPENWVWTRMGSITAVVGGGTPRSYDSLFYENGDIPWIRPVDLSDYDDMYISYGSRSITREGLKNSSARLIPKNSLLFSSRAPIGYVAIAANDVTTSQGFKSFLPTSALVPQFGYWYLKYAKPLAESLASGTTFQEISGSKAALIPIPLPPLPEQQRIAVELESLLGKIKEAKALLDEIPEILQSFRQSVLGAACTGRLTSDWRKLNPKIEPSDHLGDGEPPSDRDLPSTWNWLLSSHAFGFVTSGSRGWARYYSDEGPLFLRVGNLNHDTITLDLNSIQRVSPPSSAEGRRTKVVEGDILISITADLGMVALIEAGLEEAYINQHIALARPVGNMDRRYLSYFLAAKNGGQEQFLNLQRGATKVGLCLDDIRNIWVARPPLPEQQEIVRRVESLFAKADDLEAEYKEAVDLIEILPEIILAKAFRGELIPQDPTDEPAIKLLERILTHFSDIPTRTIKSHQGEWELMKY